MIGGIVVAVVAASIGAELAFEQRIADLPEEVKDRMRQRRHEWHEALQRQAEDTARDKRIDPAWTFLFGLALGIGLA